jgi:hypothetical protein
MYNCTSPLGPFPPAGGIPPAGRPPVRRAAFLVCSAFSKALPPPSVAGLARRLASAFPSGAAPRSLPALHPLCARPSVGRPRLRSAGPLASVPRRSSFVGVRLGVGAVLAFGAPASPFPWPPPAQGLAVMVGCPAPGLRARRLRSAVGAPPPPWAACGRPGGRWAAGGCACGRVRPACAWSLSSLLVVPWPLGVFRLVRSPGCHASKARSRATQSGPKGHP